MPTGYSAGTDRYSAVAHLAIGDERLERFPRAGANCFGHPHVHERPGHAALDEEAIPIPTHDRCAAPAPPGK